MVNTYNGIPNTQNNWQVDESIENYCWRHFNLVKGCVAVLKT